MTFVSACCAVAGAVITITMTGIGCALKVQMPFIEYSEKKISCLFIYCNASAMNMYEQLSMLSP